MNGTERPGSEARCWHCECTGQPMESLAPCRPDLWVCKDAVACVARCEPVSADMSDEELRAALSVIQAITRTWPLELQAKIIWYREFSGQRDGPSEADILAALEAMDAVEAVRR